MNRGDLRTQLRDELKTDPNGKIWRDRELNRFLTRAWNKVQSDMQYGFDENEVIIGTITTVSLQEEYTLPSNFGEMLNVKDQNSWTLDEITKRDLERRTNNTDAENTGQPTVYYLRAAKIGFWPIPIDVRTIEILYNAILTFPTDDTTALDITNLDLDFALVKYSAYLAWSSLRGNRRTALDKLEDYKDVLKDLKFRYLFKSRSMNMRTQKTTDNYYNPRGLNWPNR